MIRDWLLILLRTLWGQLAKHEGNIHEMMGYHIINYLANGSSRKVPSIIILPTFFVKLRLFQNRSMEMKKRIHLPNQELKRHEKGKSKTCFIHQDLRL